MSTRRSRRTGKSGASRTKRASRASRKPASPKPEPDYIAASFGHFTKYATNSVAPDGRRLTLYGVDVVLSQQGGQLSVNPLIPRIAPLHNLIKKHPKADKFTFDAGRWRVIQGVPPVTARYGKTTRRVA